MMSKINYSLKMYVDKGRNLEKEPTGFKDPEDVIITYDSTTRKITLTGTVEAYWRGTKIPELVSGWESIAHEQNPTTGLFLKYNADGFSWSSDIWSFDEVQIAYVLYLSDSTFIGCMRETHGLQSWQTHYNDHFARGTYRLSGGVLADYVLDSSTSTSKRPSISECIICDEDLRSTLPAHTSQDNYSILYLSNAGDLNFENSQSEIVRLNGTVPYYNQLSGGTYSQVELPRNDYMSMWLFATPVTADSASQQYRYIFMQGQSFSTTLQDELGRTPTELELSGIEELAPEYIFIAQVVIVRTGNNWEIAEIVSLTGSKASYNRTPSTTFPTEAIMLTIGDEDTDLTTGTEKFTFRMPHPLTLTSVRASVNTAPTDANIVVDINKNGVSILSTKLTIDDGDKTSTSANTEAVISDSALADDAEIIIDIDQVGSTIAGKGLKVVLIGTR